jgi:serine/threonine protein kinase
LEFSGSAVFLAEAQNMIGQTISHYKILEKLGEGGMGVVYKAQDTKLNRFAALKFLPPHLSASDADKARFVQEAQAAAALNHPNICTIYGIEESDSKMFIAMEFVEGQTLRAKTVGSIHESPLQIKQSIEIGIQIADGLEAAHEKGIVHRDVKPENMMIQKDGRVRIMDFGLAKLKGASHLTKMGSTVGTLAYMAPEQIQGGEVDSRSDIFAFGVLLFEMLSGRMPFRGEHEAAMVYSIVNEEAEPIEKHRPDLSPILVNLIQRCLEKDPNERYQTVNEIVIELRRLLKQTSKVLRSSSGMPAYKTAADPTIRAVQPEELTPDLSTTSFLKNRPLMLASAGALTIVVALAAYVFFFKGTSGAAHSFALQNMQITRITSTGKAQQAAISPDGRLIVYSELERGKQSLWVRQVATGSNVQILPPADVTYQGITISADGNYAYISKRDETTGVSALFQLPVLGGSPRKLLEDLQYGVALSSDNKRLAFTRSYSGSGEFSLLTANIDGTREKILASHKADLWFDGTPSWSADGSVLAAILGSYHGGFHQSPVGVKTQDGSETPLTDFRWYTLGKLQWFPDGSGILVDGKRLVGSLRQLWKLSYPSGEVQRVTNDLNSYESFDMSADSRSVSAVQSDQQMHLALLPGGKSDAAQRITQGKLRLSDFSWTLDGKILYVQTSAEKWKVHFMDGDGSQRRQVTVDEYDEDSPRLTPDGKNIVFVSYRSGIPNLWRVGLDGTNPTQITSGGEDYRPAISPDGKWIVFDSWDLGPLTVMKVSIDGGEPVRLSEKNGYSASISPDGKLVAYISQDEQQSQRHTIEIIPLAGGKSIKSFQLPSAAFVSTYAQGFAPLEWMPDGKSIIYIDNKGGVSNLWAQPLAGGPPRQITRFQSDQIFSYHWSPDGKTLGVVRSSTTSDVLLITSTTK